MPRLITLFSLALLLAMSARAAELRAPAQVKAGSAFSLTSDGSGGATFYLVGPASVSKRNVQLGGEIPIRLVKFSTLGATPPSFALGATAALQTSTSLQAMLPS